MTVTHLPLGIALDRCLVVRLKHRYKLVVTPLRMKLSILLIWTVALLMVYPVPWLYCRSYHFVYLGSRRMCVAADHLTQAAWLTHHQDVGSQHQQGDYLSPYKGAEGCKKVVAFVEALALIAVPVLIVLVTSLILIVGLHRRLCSQSRVVRKSVETVVIMMVGFNMCVLPYCVTVPISPVDMGGPLMLVLIFLMQLHSAINPVIYLLRSSKFRNQASSIGSQFIRSMDKRQRFRSFRQSIKQIYNR